MSNILILTPDLPSQTKAAGHKTAFKIIEALHLIGHKIILLSFNSTGIIDNDRICLEKICSKIEILDLSFGRKLLNCIKNIPVVPLIGSRICRDFEQLIDKHIQDVDIVHVEFSQMLYFVKYVNKKYANKKIIFNSHDIIFQRTYREAKSQGFLNIFKDIECFLTYFSEKHFLSYADIIIVQSKKDMKLLKGFGSKVKKISPYIAENLVPYDSSNDDPHQKYVVFFGAMNRKENYLSVLDFVANCWKSINKNYPHMAFYIMGKNPNERIEAFRDKFNIKVVGFLENPYALISKAMLAVAPIRLGAGVKVKVLECLKSGCPVVAFPAGAEGIDLNKNEGLIVVNSFVEMKKEIVNIINGRTTFDKNLIRQSVGGIFNWNETIHFLKTNYD